MNNEQQFYEHLLAEEKRLTTMEQDIKALSEKIDSLETSVSNLVSAWNTASGVVTFVKWLAGLATAVTTIVALMKLVK